MPLVNGRNVTWQWVVGVLLILVLASGGIILADTKKGVEKTVDKIELLQEKKVDKDQYRLDISEIKESLRTIGIKLDNLNKRQ